MGNAHDKRYGETWRTIDFRSAPKGWRIAYLEDDGGMYFEPLAGWLIQEYVDYERDGRRTSYGHDGVTAENRPRRVVAAGASRRVVAASTEAIHYWRVFGPGEQPTEGPPTMASSPGGALIAQLQSVLHLAKSKADTHRAGIHAVANDHGQIAAALGAAIGGGSRTAQLAAAMQTEARQLAAREAQLISAIEGEIRKAGQVGQ